MALVGGINSYSIGRQLPAYYYNHPNKQKKVQKRGGERTNERNAHNYLSMVVAILDRFGHTVKPKLTDRPTDQPNTSKLACMLDEVSICFGLPRLYFLFFLDFVDLTRQSNNNTQTKKPGKQYKDIRKATISFEPIQYAFVRRCCQWVAGLVV